MYLEICLTPLKSVDPARLVSNWNTVILCYLWWFLSKPAISHSHLSFSGCLMYKTWFVCHKPCFARFKRNRNDATRETVNIGPWIFFFFQIWFINKPFTIRKTHDHFKGDKKEKTWYTVSALLPFCMVSQLRNPMSSFVLVIKKKSKQATSLPYLV